MADEDRDALEEESEDLLAEAGPEEEAAVPGRPLPKKVELDIDELGEPGEEEEEEPAPLEAPPEEEAEVPVRKPLAKLLLLGGGALVVLLALVGLVLFLVSGPEEAPRQAGGPTTLRLEPFLVNLTGPGRETVLKLTMAVTFSSPQAQEEFLTRRLALRDLIYRYIQGNGAGDLNQPQAKTALQDGLIRLLNESLRAGGVKQVMFEEFLLV